eukprot:9482656-Pyramimonas_sp.AAC.1
MLEAYLSPTVDYSTTGARIPREPSRPVRLTRAEEEVKMCRKEDVERLRRLKNEANRLRRSYR